MMVRFFASILAMSAILLGGCSTGDVCDQQPNPHKREICQDSRTSSP